MPRSRTFNRDDYVKQITRALVDHLRGQYREAGLHMESCCYREIDPIVGKMMRSFCHDLLAGFKLQLSKSKTKREYEKAIENFAKEADVAL